MKLLLVVGALCAMSVGARADGGKSTPAPAKTYAKLDGEARVFVVDKAAPSLDKTAPLQRPRAASKDK